jgi:hypothetical protein
MTEEEKASACACAFARLKNSIAVELRAQAGMKKHKRAKVKLTEEGLEVFNAVVDDFDFLVDLQNFELILGKASIMCKVPVSIVLYFDLLQR